MSNLINKLQKLAKTNTYMFESPITIKAVDHNGDEFDCGDLSQFKEYVNDVKEAVKSDMDDLGSQGLAQYLNQPLQTKIDSIIVTVNLNKARTIVTANEDLTDAELYEIEDYITGQFSDGWGEGFEQSPIDEYTVDASEFYEKPSYYNDDEEEEDYEYDETIKISVYAHFYNSSGWSITQI